MAFIIKHRQLEPDSWQLLKPAAEGAWPQIPLAGDIIVPLALWREHRDVLLFRVGRLGVWLEPEQDPALVAGDFAHLSLLAVNFPHFTDGRGYSIARLLRERHGWRGELRAIGDILRDQLGYLARCGFDAWALRADQDARAALKAFDDFSEAYQASVERPLPLFRRRATPSCDEMKAQ